MGSKVIELLQFMDETLEEAGCTPMNFSFVFKKEEELHYFNAPSEVKPESEDRTTFKKKYNVNDEELDKALKIAMSNSWIEFNSMDEDVRLTEDGRDYLRAYSYNKTQSKPEPSQQFFNIQQIHGNAQIGNHNIQNINAAFEQLIQEINNSSATLEQKNEAKSKLVECLNNPIIVGVLTATATEGLKKLLGL